MRRSGGIPFVRPPSARRARRDGSVLERWLGLTCVLGACLFVFWQMRPDLIFADTTPAGGDMAAHVWGPAFLRDYLLPSGRLTGWAPDWYAGFPAYQFYMVLPSLAIALASFVMPYGVAFKLVSIAGLVTLPLAAATFMRLAGMRFPAPIMAALFMLPFLFDTSFNILGGNVASTLAGEFAYSISLSLMLVYLGVVLRGLRTGRHRVMAGVLLALVGLTHLIPAIFAVGATGVAFVMRPGRRSVRWLTATGILAAMLAAFWLLPFWWWRDYYHNIDWVNTREYWPKLVRDDWSWVLVLAWVGLLTGIVYRQRVSLYLAALAALAAAAYRWVPQGVLWNGRMLPFYYVSMMLLAAAGVSTLLRMLLVVAPQGDVSGDRTGSDHRGNEGSRSSSVVATAGSLRVRVAVACVLSGGSVALAALAAADGAGLRALLKVLPGTDGATAAQRAVDVADLAVLILVAAALLLVAELVRSFRGHGVLWRVRRVVLRGWRSPAGVAQRSARPPTGMGASDTVVPRRRESIRPLSGDERDPSGNRLLVVATAAVTLVMVLAVAYPLRALGVAGDEGDDGRYGLRVAPNVVLAGTTESSFLPFWVDWNFSGYEGKEPGVDGGGYEEYSRIVATMAQLTADRGCGRVMWEYGEERLESYGSPTSLMLLPYWTDGCVGSMEGLFFESTLTVPFHFINQDELSAASSRPVRAVEYGGTDLDAGVAHMQLFGVRYYMAYTEPLVSSARAHPDLAVLAAEPPWVIFEVADAPLVSPLMAEPVVVAGLGDDPERWLDVAVPFYRDYVGSGALGPASTRLSSAAVFPAADGPPHWVRVPADADRPVRALEETEVYGVSTTTDSISFHVTEVGVPVLVKTSYFPNWRVENGRGPYRVAPNLMVVVPEATQVTLHYGRTAVEVLALVITGLGLILALVLLRRPHVWAAERTRRRPR